MRQVTLVTALLAVAAFGCMVFWQPRSEVFWQRAGYQFVSQVWVLLAVAAVLMFVYERFLRRRLAAELARISGESIVDSMPPKQLMESFLRSVYGANEANRDIVTGLLGSDLTISTHTDLEMRLTGINADFYELRLTADYRFRNNVTATSFVVFATCDTALRDSISYVCEHPLFDLWFVDPEGFEDSVDSMLTSTRIGLDYVDVKGRMHRAPVRKAALHEIKFRDWSRYLQLLREDVGPLPRLHAQDLFGRLRMFHCDLNSLADPAEPIRSIERFSVSQATRQRLDYVGCYWQAPYPCYVGQLVVDATELSLDGGPDFELCVVPFSFRAGTAGSPWRPAASPISLRLGSWLLPGHGVNVSWREKP